MYNIGYAVTPTRPVDVPSTFAIDDELKNVYYPKETSQYFCRIGYLRAYIRSRF